MSRRHATHRFAFLCAATLGLALSGCSGGGGSLFDKSSSGGGLFSGTSDLFATPDWARASDKKSVQLGPSGPVGPEDLVNADGSCAPATVPEAAAAAQAAPASQATPAAAPPQGLEGRLEPGGSFGAPPVLGGIALGMTECQAVRRAGQPSNVAIGADEHGTRKTVITYLTGPWPGIYTFSSGRLKVVDRAPEPEKPVKPAPKKRAKPRTASQGR